MLPIAMTCCVLLWTKGVYAQSSDRYILTIEEMFSLADQNSKSLRPKSTGIAEAQAAVKEAKNARLPDIEASVSASFLGNGCLIERDFSHGTKAAMPHWGNNFAIEVTQIIYSGGAVSGGIELAELEERLAQLALEKNRDAVRFLLVGYYMDLFKQQNVLKVYDRNIALTARVLDNMRTRYAEGVALKNDITRYELLLADLELSRTQLKNSIDILNHNLITTLGLPAGTQLMADTTLLEQILPDYTANYWHEQTMANATELKQQDIVVQMSRQQERIARSERLPQVAFVAANHFDGPITIEVPPINQNFNYWYVGLGVKYNLSSLFKTNKSIRRARLAMQRSTEELDDVREQKELAVRADYIRYRETYEQFDTQRKRVDLAAQNFDVIYHRYTNELALVTDMLDASNTKLNAEVELVNARINILFNYYKLLYQSGTI